MKPWPLILMLLVGCGINPRSSKLEVRSSQPDLPSPISHLALNKTLPGAAPKEIFSAGGFSQPEAVLPPTIASITPLSPAVTLEWNGNADAAAYQVYYGQAAHSYESLQPVGLSTAATIAGLQMGRTYYFAVTEVDAFGVESDFSDECTSTPEARVFVRLGLGGTLQSSTNLIDWHPRTAVADADGWDVFINPAYRPTEFFRIETNQ